MSIKTIGRVEDDMFEFLGAGKEASRIRQFPVAVPIFDGLGHNTLHFAPSCHSIVGVSP